MRFNNLYYQQVLDSFYLFMSLFSHWFARTPVDTWLLKEKRISLCCSASSENPALLWLSCWLVFLTGSTLFSFCCHGSHHFLTGHQPFLGVLWSFLRTLRGDFDSADAINAFPWGKASDIHCSEGVQATNYLIKMGNKQTIFTDEQLDAYQVRWRVVGGQ